MSGLVPWSRVFVSGASVGSLALGVGMRWREGIVDIVERQPNPAYEESYQERCVISLGTIRLLKELGVSEERFMKTLRPAQKWRYADAKGDITTEGSWYSGCPEGEPCYHISSGDLRRFLRREFFKFGGRVNWGSEVENIHQRGETTTKLWTMEKTFGPLVDGSLVFGGDGQRSIIRPTLTQFLSPWPLRGSYTYRMGSGQQEDISKKLLEPGVDFIVALSRGLVLHIWKPFGDTNKTLAWTCTTPANVSPDFEKMHAMFRNLIAASPLIQTKTCDIPYIQTATLTTPETKEYPVTLIGSALLPIDRFQLRGDRASVEIEEAANLIQRIFGKTYRRVDSAFEMRKYEHEFLNRRVSLLDRDVGDITTLLEQVSHVDE